MNLEGGADMEAAKTISPASRCHIETVGGARYEVTSYYVGEVTLIDLLKLMLKRDMERERPDDCACKPKAL